MITLTGVLYMTIIVYVGSNTVDYLNEHHTSEPEMTPLTDEEIKALKLHDPMDHEEMMLMLEEFDKNPNG